MTESDATSTSETTSPPTAPAGQDSDADTEAAHPGTRPLQERLAPYMRHYYAPSLAGPVWMPYVMYHFGLPNAVTPAYQLDDRGFRRSTWDDGHVSAVDLLDGRLVGSPVDLVLGGSMAWGTGASNDAHTLASQLSKLLSRPVVNLAMGGWVIQQNLVQWLFMDAEIPRAQRVDTIWVVAGYNELLTNLLADVIPTTYGSFYGWNQYFAALNADVLGDGAGALRLPASVGGLLAPAADARADVGRRTGLALHALQTLAETRGARVRFVLQPVAPWMAAPSAAEQSSLIEEWLTAFPEQRTLVERHTAAYAGFATDLAVRCGRLGIDFLDLNPLLADVQSHDDWWFNDVVHLNDDGLRIVAETLAGTAGAGASSAGA